MRVGLVAGALSVALAGALIGPLSASADTPPQHDVPSGWWLIGSRPQNSPPPTSSNVATATFGVTAIDTVVPIRNQSELDSFLNSGKTMFLTIDVKTGKITRVADRDY
jgi:hypothetical protein